MKKDTIMNLCMQVKFLIEEIKEEEDRCNEGALTDIKYKEIIDMIIRIETERIMQITFWEEK